MRETDYYEKQSAARASSCAARHPRRVLFAIGYDDRAAITMYARSRNRQREIGTLRALGFSRPTVLLSFLLESVCSRSPAAPWAHSPPSPWPGKFSMMNLASWSEIVFEFARRPAS